jgi:CRP/FNR family cyclic AMP-dependent transcriptional regulator
MKFASREGTTARTLAMTAAGWYTGAKNGASSPTAAPVPTAAKTAAAGTSPYERRERQSAVSRTATVSLRRGEELFSPGRGLGNIYIVRAGCVRLYKVLPDGRSINLGLLGPGNVITQEVDADGLSSGSVAEAVVDSTVTVVEADDLVELIRRTPELANAVVQGMSRRLSELQILAEHLLARDTSVRLATTLVSLARNFGRPAAGGLTALTLPVTHQQLANMIGSNRVTVTRKLLELQEQGAVKSLGRNALAVDPDKLLAHARAATTPSE